MSLKYDYSASFNPPATGANRVTVMRIPIDFTELGITLAQNEIMSIGKVKDGMLFLAQSIEVVRAQSDISDVDLGISTDGSTAAGWHDGFTIASVDKCINGSVTPAWITADNYIVLTNKDAQTISSAKIIVNVVLADAR